MSNAPIRLTGSGPVTVALDLDPDLVVVRLEGGKTPAWAESVLRDGAETFAVARAKAPAVGRERKSGRSLGPVYKAAASGAVAVPTGRLTLQLAEGTPTDGLTVALDDLGFDIIRRSDTMMLVQPRKHDIADALDKIEIVAGLAGAQAVTPQLLYPKATK
ncbi:hypothetical protein [Prosthecomicrobium hirschii]|uniref:hypothetical protein n=1 Tax=Prosthecodimorpha hirschii TaxID=665126 RepID=UPI00128FBB2A|nr:hypothetical protein [Prosthecomicrobium hirschii]